MADSDIRETLEKLAELAKSKFGVIGSVQLSDENLIINVCRPDAGLRMLLEGYLAATGLTYRTRESYNQIVVNIETEPVEVFPDPETMFLVLDYDDLKDHWIRRESPGKRRIEVDIDALGRQGWRPVLVLKEQYTEDDWSVVLWQREPSVTDIAPDAMMRALGEVLK